jgi:hypothetical protein
MGEEPRKLWADAGLSSLIAIDKALAPILKTLDQRAHIAGLKEALEITKKALGDG